MFGFHQRNRSLIPVRDMDKLEEKEKASITTTEIAEIYPEDSDAEEDSHQQTPRQRRNLIMIYLLFLASSLMSASLTSQIAILVPSTTSNCITPDTSFLRSILECSYYFGSVAGVFWGRAADTWGRRRVALAGLVGMSCCCVGMGFARSFGVFAGLRFVAGVVSSATAVSGLAMLADVTHGSKRRTKMVARLPVIAVCGPVGPLAATGLKGLVAGSGLGGVLEQYPGLASQIACAGLVFAVTVSEAFMLEETLPSLQIASPHQPEDIDPEKAAFLPQSPRPSTDSTLSITIMEALADTSATPRPSRLSTYDLLTAPSVTLTLISYALLSLHSSTFDTLLPHLGHTATHAGGLGIPCAWLQPVVLAVEVVAALRILTLVPAVVERMGLLKVYRRISVAFPVLYAVVPLLAVAVNATSGTEGMPVFSAVVNTVAMLAKTTLAGAAQVLVLLLIMSAAPDASSTGSVIGIVSIAELFKALAVGASGMSYYLSDGYGVVVVNGMAWTGLGAVALAGLIVTRRLRERPRVGADIPEECLVWEGMWDSESEDGRGF